MTATAVPSSYLEIGIPKLNEVVPPETTRTQLANDMIVYLLEDHEVPLVTFSALIRAGSRWDPAGKAGLANLTTAVMRYGGTAARTADQLDDLLDDLGATLDISASEDVAKLTLSLLSSDVETGLAIFTDVLQHPAFSPDALDRIQALERAEIIHAQVDVGRAAVREFHALVYGESSPYVHHACESTINAINQDDLFAFHREHFRPENIVLGAWGDFDTHSLRARISHTFSSWAKGHKPTGATPQHALTARRDSIVHLMDREGATTTWVLMGRLIGLRNESDYPALRIANEIFGACPLSRLFEAVREKQPLAYSVQSQCDAGWDRPGVLLAVVTTVSSKTLELLEAVLCEMHRMGKALVAEEELMRAKSGLILRMAFDMESTAKAAEALMSIEYFHYPLSYISEWRRRIERVSAADVLRVARDIFDLEKVTIVLAGDCKVFQDDARTLIQQWREAEACPAPSLRSQGQTR